MKLLANLVREDTDSLSKANVDKVTEALKKINDLFDSLLDSMLAEFKEANTDNRTQN